MIRFLFFFLGPVSLQWDRYWPCRQGLAKATESSMVKKTKKSAVFTSTSLFAWFWGHFPLLGDAVEDVMAARSPYPPALVPSSAFLRAASSPSFLS